MNRAPGSRIIKGKKDNFRKIYCICVTNIENPDFLKIHIDKLIEQHRLYGVNDEYIHFFISSIGKTFRDMFGPDDSLI